MGQEFPYKSFVDDDYVQFNERLLQETRALRSLFDSHELRCEDSVGGFELEAWLVNTLAEPVAENERFLACLNDPEVVPELSLFNIEINVEPLALKDNALRMFEDRLRGNWRKCRTQAQALNLDVMSIGVHPALKDEQLTIRNMSKSDRYKALNEQILSFRNETPIQMDIQGRDHLHSEHFDVMLEAAATSFQIHLQVSQENALRAYNASQIISAPLVAISANSPFVFGLDLWDESRIPIFEQAVDVGGSGPQRVCFGEAYLKHSLMECFNQNVEQYPVLIPVSLDGAVDPLPHLRLHNGTIWRWNRPLVGFAHSGEAHVRIENRVVAAGPTLSDMVANAAFFWGLVTAMTNQASPPEDGLPFGECKKNFYCASKHGLAAKFTWLDGKRYDCSTLVLNTLLPLAKLGLEALDMNAEDIEHYLGVIAARVTTGQNGAQWQRQWVKKHGKNMQALSRAYLIQQNTQRPVHEWDI